MKANKESALALCAMLVGASSGAIAADADAISRFKAHPATEFRAVADPSIIADSRQRLVRGARVGGKECRFDYTTPDATEANTLRLEVGRNGETCESLVLEGQLADTAMLGAFPPPEAERDGPTRTGSRTAETAQKLIGYVPF